MTKILDKKIELYLLLESELFSVALPENIAVEVLCDTIPGRHE